VQHLQQLAAAPEGGLQVLRGLVRQGPRHGLHAGAEEGEHLGIDPVGLRQATERAGEVAHLPGIDHGDGEAGRRQGRGHRGFEAAGGFEHNERDGLRLTLGD
jgi:hypothetical protein